ncbi:MAG TPA: SGNH/GDSL hydrolase family protein [Stellaceae bacterium]|nr:SGNH/GDSL hydrolase family protein [Stellaceae bacterium]
MNLGLAGMVLLVIGDSHIAGFGTFNNTLHDGLLAQGAMVHTFGLCGSVPSGWIIPQRAICGSGERHNGDPAQISKDDNSNGWSLPALISRYNPDLVVVELGENLALYGISPRLSSDWINSEVSGLLLPIRAAKLPCVWVGPPWGGEKDGPYKKTFARVEELSDYLSHVVSPCQYVDSLAFSRPGEWPTLDGVHLTAASTRLWDSDVIHSIDQFAATLPDHPTTAEAGAPVAAAAAPKR